MPPRPYRTRPGPKLDTYDIAAIRAWCEGPGRLLSSSQQAKELLDGVDGWWLNVAGVGYCTLLAIVTKASWPSVKADSQRLKEWRFRLERLKVKGPLGLDVVG